MLRATVIGNLGADPEMRYSAQGTLMLTMTVASNDRSRDADGNFVETTTWTRVTMFGTRGEAIAPHLSKGQRIYAVGRMQVRPWINNQGQAQGGVEITADSIEFMSPKEEQQQGEPPQQPAAAAQRPSGAPVSQQRRPVPAGAAAPARGPRQPQQVAYDMEEDPF